MTNSSRDQLIKMYEPDISNFNATYHPWVGSTIKTARNDKKDDVREIYEHICNQTLDTSKVVSRPVAAFCVRKVVEHEMHQVTPANGHKPRQVVINMNGHVRHLAQNVDSVKRVEETHMTIGGVETEVQYMDGLNELQANMGNDGLLRLHELLGATHQFAIGRNNNNRRHTAALSMTTCTYHLRDALCDHLQLPETAQNQVANLQRDVTSRDATIQTQREEIRQHLVTIRTQDTTIATLQADFAATRNAAIQSNTNVQVHRTTIEQLKQSLAATEKKVENGLLLQGELQTKNRALGRTLVQTQEKEKNLADTLKRVQGENEKLKKALEEARKQHKEDDNGKNTESIEREKRDRNRDNDERHTAAHDKEPPADSPQNHEGDLRTYDKQNGDERTEQYETAQQDNEKAQQDDNVGSLEQSQEFPEKDEHNLNNDERDNEHNDGSTNQVSGHNLRSRAKKRQRKISE